MAKNNEADEFSEQIKELRDKRAELGLGVPRLSIGDADTVSRALASLKPVIDVFVGGDPLLTLQASPSSQFNGFHIGYAHAKNYRFTITAPAKNIVDIRIAYSQPAMNPSVYSGPMTEKAIQQALRRSLLDWYRQL